MVLYQKAVPKASRKEETTATLCEAPASNGSSTLGSRLVMSLDFIVSCGEMFWPPYMH